MPVFESVHWSKEAGSTLEITGPVIAVEVGIPESVEIFRIKKRLAVPPRVAGLALIDTGASISAVHEDLLKALSIKPIDQIPSRTPHGSGPLVYPARVSFPTIEIKDYGISRVIGCDLKWEAHDGAEVIMLLGRDLLKHFLMVYNGPGSVVTLAY